MLVAGAPKKSAAQRLARARAVFENCDDLLKMTCRELVENLPRQSVHPSINCDSIHATL